MRYRVKDYTIEGQYILLPEQITIDDLRLVVNETQKKVICSSMQKNNVDVQSDSIGVPASICTLQPTDQLTIEIDKGDSLADIKLPEFDTTDLAKQGDDKNATLTAIYKMLVGNDEPSQDIPEGVAERLALILEFFGMKPIESYEFMTAEEVCSTLEEIMTTMDLDLTPEKAKEITNNTLNKG